MTEKTMQGRARALEISQLDLAYRRLKTSLLSTLLIASLLVAALWPIVTQKTLLTWFAAMWLIVIMRNQDLQSYLRFARDSGTDLKKYRTRFAIGSAAGGIGWGASIYLFLVSPQDGVTEMLLFIIAGVTAVASVSMSTMPKAASAFLLAALLPLAIWLFSFGERLHYFMCAIVLVYLGLMLLFSRQMSNIVRTSLLTTVQNKELSESAEESNHRMTHYFKSAPGCFYTALWQSGRGYAMPFSSDSIADMFGLNPEDVVLDMMPLIAMVHCDDKEMLRRKAWKSVLNLSPFRLEFRINHPLKGVRWVEANAITQRSLDGGLRWDGFMHDITERKLLEAALISREQETRTLIQNTPDTIARYNRDCRRTFVNNAFGKIVEGGDTLLLGATPSEYPGGPDAAMYEAKINEVFATGQGTDFELYSQDRNGKEICSHVRLTAERDVSGEVISVLAVGRDITELNASRRKIHQMVFYDSLTSLPNRALFNDRLRQLLKDASWHGQMAGVMLLDLDRFKVINDTLGHPAGDELLRETAGRLKNCVRSYDTTARLGGDEFAILLSDIRTGDDLGRIANKILEAFDEPFILEGKEVFISSSVGISVYPDDSSDADDLIKQADSAMYFAKRSGRNNFRFYSRDLTASSSESLMLESELRRAVERKELELYYQPKIWLTDGALIGSEALLRWNNPQRGLVSPDQFISIAEDSGLIVGIGEWVLHEACRTARNWNGANKPLHKVAINLSARQFQSNDLLKTVTDALEETGCYPEWIELEITESLLLDEHNGVLETLEAFRSMGITIAIDDFGTGYSALSYLACYPIDTLKIDRSFIHTVTTDNFRAELVKAIISVAKSLGQHVVAEGVETEEQVAFLRAHGCQIAQGYLYSKPVAKSTFELLPQLCVQA
jgi:diguanylate cyclase (GGDEF)-like protein/PAS domain S-box-containing protein